MRTQAKPCTFVGLSHFPCCEFSLWQAVMRDIEAKGRESWTNGDADAWLDTAIPAVRTVVESVNGPLLHYLGVKAMHTGIACVENSWGKSQGKS